MCVFMCVVSWHREVFKITHHVKKNVTDRRRISQSNLADLGLRGGMGFGRFLATYPSESRTHIRDFPEIQYDQPSTLNRLRVAL